MWYESPINENDVSIKSRRWWCQLTSSLRHDPYVKWIGLFDWKDIKRWHSNCFQSLRHSPRWLESQLYRCVRRHNSCFRNLRRSPDQRVVEYQPLRYWRRWMRGWKMNPFVGAIKRVERESERVICSKRYSRDEPATEVQQQHLTFILARARYQTLPHR